MGRVTSKGNEAKSKMKQPSDMAHAEIRTHVVVTCGPMLYQLDHGGGQTNGIFQVNTVHKYWQK